MKWIGFSHLIFLFIPRESNTDANLLAIIELGGDHLDIDGVFMQNNPTISIYKPFISDNIVYLQIFENDIQIKDFFQVQG